jgi:hypothetical protein
MPDLPLTAYQADSAGAILTTAQSQVSGVTIDELDSNRSQRRTPDNSQDFAHLPLAPPVAHRSIPDPVLHHLGDGV